MLERYRVALSRLPVLLLLYFGCCVTMSASNASPTSNLCRMSTQSGAKIRPHRLVRRKEQACAEESESPLHANTQSCKPCAMRGLHWHATGGTHTGNQICVLESPQRSADRSNRGKTEESRALGTLSDVWFRSDGSERGICG